MKLYLLLNQAPRYEDVLGKRRYSFTHSYPQRYLKVSGQLHASVTLRLG